MQRLADRWWGAILTVVLVWLLLNGSSGGAHAGVTMGADIFPPTPSPSKKPQVIETAGEDPRQSASTASADGDGRQVRPPMPPAMTLLSPDSEGDVSTQAAMGSWFYVDEGMTLEHVEQDFLTGQYLVAWTKVGNDGYPDLYVRVFDRYGHAVYPTVKIGDRGQMYTRIAYNPRDNEYLLVWDPGYYAVYAQRLNYKGEPLGSRSEIIGNVGGAGGVLEVVYNYEEKEYFVLFNVLKSDWWAAAGQRVNADGTLNGSYFWIVGDLFMGGDMVYHPFDNRYLVVGEWGGSGSNGWDIHGQFVDADGSNIGGHFAIDTYQNSQRYPMVTWRFTSNEYLVIWQDDYQDSDTEDIFGRRLDANGAVVGPYIPVANDDYVTKYPNDLVYDWQSDSYLAVWSVWWVDPETYREHRWSYARGIALDGGLPLPGNVLWYPTHGKPAATRATQEGYVVGMAIDGDIWCRFVKAWERVYLPLVVRN